MFELAEYLVETGRTFGLGLAWTRFLLMFSVGFFLLMGFFMPVSVAAVATPRNTPLSHSLGAT